MRGREQIFTRELLAPIIVIIGGNRRGLRAMREQFNVRFEGVNRTWEGALKPCDVYFWPFGGHAEKTQSMSLLGVKRTWIDAPHMSAFDPKRTFELYP
jgi:hypothetical protein